LEFFIPHGTNSRINQLSSLSFFLYPNNNTHAEGEKEGRGGREGRREGGEREEGGREREKGGEGRGEKERRVSPFKDPLLILLLFTMFFSVFLTDLCLVPGAERERERERGETESFKIEKKL
jgi:hypothetical protein